MNRKKIKGITVRRHLDTSTVSASKGGSRWSIMVSIRGEKKYYPVEPPLYMNPKFWVQQTDPTTGAAMREKAIIHAKGNPNSKAIERSLSAKEEEIWALITNQLDKGVQPDHSALWRQWGKDTSCSLNECVVRFLQVRALRWRGGQRGGTAKEFQNKLTIVLRYAQNVPISAINIDWVRGLHTWLINDAIPLGKEKRGYSQNSSSAVLATLGALLNHAIEEGQIKENAVALYKRSSSSASTRIVPAVAHPLSEEDIERLQSFWDQGNLSSTFHRYLQLVLVSIYTGFRCSDLQQLYDPSKFQLIGDHLQIVSVKTQKPLRIFVTKRLASVLCPQQNGGLLLGNSKSLSSASDKLRRLLTALGMERKMVWHDLRKTFVSIMYARTGDLNAVSKAVGHSTIAVTEEHYLKTANSHIDRVMASLDDIGTDKINVSAIDILHEVAAMVTSNPSIRVTPRMSDLLRKHCGVETSGMMRVV